MNPFYESDDITIYHGRWRQVLQNLHQVDLIVTDPPYSETNIAWDTADNRWIKEINNYDLLSHRGSLWVFGSMRYLFNVHPEMMRNDFSFAQEVVWEKHNGSNSMVDRFRRVHEFAAQYYSTRFSGWKSIYKNPIYTMDGQKKAVIRRQSPGHWSKLREGHYHSDLGGKRLVRSVIRMRSCHGAALWPTQKPLDLVKLLLQHSCPPKGTVLDMHMGSGTTLIAARQLGMKAIGIDSNLKACEIAVQRLRRETGRRLKTFDN